MALEEGKVIPAIYDKVFKSIMMGNKEFLADIISGISGIEKEEIMGNLVFKNVEYPIGNIEEKRKTSDLIVEVKNNIINVEMNRVYYKGLSKKNEKYIAKIYTVFEDKGETFIQINIDNFNKTKRIITKYEMMDKETEEVDGSIIKYRINLALIEEKYYNEEELTKLEKELLMLKINDKKHMKEISMGDKLMEEVNKNINKLSEDKLIQLEYDYDEYLRYESTQVGLEQKSREIAKKLLDDNISIDLIQKYTGLTKEEIEDLK